MGRNLKENDLTAAQRQALIEEMIPRVDVFLRWYCCSWKRRQHCDGLRQQIMLQICRGASRFQADRGAAWPTFAHWQIRGGITQYWRRVRRRGLRGGGKLPYVVNLEDGPDSQAIGDLAVSSDPPPVDTALIRDLLAVLPRRSRDIVTMYVLDGHTLDDVGQKNGGVSRERVRQLLIRAYAKMRAACERRGLTLSDYMERR